MEVLANKQIDTAYVQHIRKKNKGCRFFGAKDNTKLFWMGIKEKFNDVGTCVAEKWVDKCC